MLAMSRPRPILWQPHVSNPEDPILPPLAASPRIGLDPPRHALFATRLAILLRRALPAVRAAAQEEPHDDA
jgi:hypothetical protein